MSKPIYVTQPYLPPLEEFIPYLEQIWENKILIIGKAVPSIGSCPKPINASEDKRVASPYVLCVYL